MATKWTDLPTPPGFNVIKEGTASVLVPDGNQVFYNEVQEFNRDLSVLVISQFSTNIMNEMNTKAQQWIEKTAANNQNTTIETSTAIDDATFQPSKKQKPSPTIEAISTKNDNMIDAHALSSPLVSLSDSTTSKACYQDNIPKRFQYNGVRIFEALSASGLRSIRYYNEIPYVDTIHVNDMDTEAVESIRRNVIYNQLDINKVIPNRNEATAALYANRAVTYDLVHNKVQVHKTSTLPLQPDTITDDHPLAFLYKHQHFDTQSLTSDCIPNLPLWNVVDLDPYGSAAPFLDAAIQAVQDGGLLCVTCTDGAVLCGNYPETGFGKYNAIPLHAIDISKEYGLRMLLHTIEATASRYGRHITPLVALSIDFYMRVFVKITTSQHTAKFSGSRQSMVSQCTNCRNMTTQTCLDATPTFDTSLPISQQTKAKFSIPQNNLPTQCEFCLCKTKLYGPIWSDPIHDQSFVAQCVQSLRHRQYSSLYLNEKLELITGGSKETNEEQVVAKIENAEKTQKKNLKSSDIFHEPPTNLHLTATPRVLNQFGTYQRLNGMLSMVQSELPTVMGFPLSSFAQGLNISTPSISTFISALINAGYAVSESHTAPNLIKTNAPNSFFIDFLKATLLVNNGCVGKIYETLIHLPRKVLANGMVYDLEGNEITFDDDEETKKQEYLNDPSNATFLEWIEKKDAVRLPTQALNINPLSLKNQYITKWTELHISDEKKRQLEQEKAGKKVRDIKALSYNTTNSWWVLSQPMKHQINFKTRQRTKIGVFFANPTAYWGPKAMAGSFNHRGYTDLSLSAITGTETNENSANSTKNISRALAHAQQQRALDNQGRLLKKRAANNNEGTQDMQ